MLQSLSNPLPTIISTKIPITALVSTAMQKLFLQLTNNWFDTTDWTFLSKTEKHCVISNHTEWLVRVSIRWYVTRQFTWKYYRIIDFEDSNSCLSLLVSHYPSLRRKTGPRYLYSNLADRKNMTESMGEKIRPESLWSTAPNGNSKRKSYVITIS